MAICIISLWWLLTLIILVVLFPSFAAWLCLCSIAWRSVLYLYGDSWLWSFLSSFFLPLPHDCASVLVTQSSLCCHYSFVVSSLFSCFVARLSVTAYCTVSTLDLSLDTACCRSSELIPLLCPSFDGWLCSFTFLTQHIVALLAPLSSVFIFFCAWLVIQRHVVLLPFLVYLLRQTCKTREFLEEQKASASSRSAKASALSAGLSDSLFCT